MSRPNKIPEETIKAIHTEVDAIKSKSFQFAKKRKSLDDILQTEYTDKETQKLANEARKAFGLKDKADAKVDNTAFGSSWNDITDVAPSKEALYEYLNSLAPSSDMWTKEEDTADSNVRARKTGNYGLGHTNFTGADTWSKLDVVGSIKATGNYIMATDGSTIGPTDGTLTLHSTNGALLPTKFMIGTGTAGVPLEISLAEDELLDLQILQDEINKK